MLEQASEGKSIVGTSEDTVISEDSMDLRGQQAVDQLVFGGECFVTDLICSFCSLNEPTELHVKCKPDSGPPSRRRPAAVPPLSRLRGL